MTEITTLKSDLNDSKVCVFSSPSQGKHRKFLAMLLTWHSYVKKKTVFCTFKAFIQFKLSPYEYLLILYNHTVKMILQIFSSFRFLLSFPAIA